MKGRVHLSVQRLNNTLREISVFMIRMTSTCRQADNHLNNFKLVRFTLSLDHTCNLKLFHEVTKQQALEDGMVGNYHANIKADSNMNFPPIAVPPNYVVA